MRRTSAVILVALLGVACGGLPFEGPPTGTACQTSAAPGVVVPQRGPTAEGEPLEGLDVTSMTPAEVGDAAVEAGLDVNWRYYYGVGHDERMGYSECWCVPPTDGRVADVSYGGAGEAVVYVESDRRLAAARPQPALGWGC